MIRQSKVVMVWFKCILAAATSLAGAADGWFGLAVNVDAGGFFLSPTVRSAQVIKVMPNSPAAAHGIKAGDQLIEVEGMQVVDGDAKRLQSVMKKRVGELLRLKLKRPNGGFYVADMKAESKPKANGT